MRGAATGGRASGSDASAAGRIAVVSDAVPTVEATEVVLNPGAQAILDDAVASARMEGVEIPPEDQALAARYLAGEIDREALALLAKRQVLGLGL